MKLYQLNSRRDRPRRFRHINVLASVMTTMNLYMGTTSILASIGLEFRWAATCILLAIGFDVLDGFVARLTRSVSDFGKELDSLCDMVSFGVAPAVLVFVAYLPADAHLPLSPRAESIVGMTGAYMAIIYVICAALRLARYNTYHSERRDIFIGLPSPAAGGTLAAFVLFLAYFEQRLDSHALGPLAYIALGPAAVLLALLMVSPIPYPKGGFKAFLLRPRRAFVTLAITAVSITVAHYAITRSAVLVLFPLALAYVLYGIGDALHARLTGRPRPAGMDLDMIGEEESDGAFAQAAESGEEPFPGDSVKKAERL